MAAFEAEAVAVAPRGHGRHREGTRDTGPRGTRAGSRPVAPAENAFGAAKRDSLPDSPRLWNGGCLIAGQPLASFS
jgi:hypothetical protein